MTDNDKALAERLLWHVEQVLGPVSDEPIVNEDDSDKAVLLFNFQAETKRAIDYWYRQGRDDQYTTHADRIEAQAAEIDIAQKVILEQLKARKEQAEEIERLRQILVDAVEIMNDQMPGEFPEWEIYAKSALGGTE